MKLTVQKLKEMNACQAGIGWFKKHGDVCAGKTVKKLLKAGKENWAFWLIENSKISTKTAIKLAELVLPIYENECPTDGRPRKAIVAAKIYLKNPTEENLQLLTEASDAASEARDAAFNAAYYAAYATYSAARNAVYYVSSAARTAAHAAYYAAYVSKQVKNTKLFKKIINIIAKELEYKPRSKK